MSGSAASTFLENRMLFLPNFDFSRLNSRLIIDLTAKRSETRSSDFQDGRESSFLSFGKSKVLSPRSTRIPFIDFTDVWRLKFWIFFEVTKFVFSSQLKLNLKNTFRTYASNWTFNGTKLSSIRGSLWKFSSNFQMILKLSGVKNYQN